MKVKSVWGEQPMMNGKKHSVMSQFIEHFAPCSRWRIDHKRLWLDYLETGILPFDPKNLHNALRQIIDNPQNMPRGERLLHLRKKHNFTMKEDKTPYRPEEALERFLVVSNGDNFFNQVPVGGGKESIDIVILKNRKTVEFIELKPWSSCDSPLYGLVESLKNLIEYRVILERQIEHQGQRWDVGIRLLAPYAYFQNFRLVNGDGTVCDERLHRTKGLLRDLAAEFSVDIAVSSLPLTADRFNRACAELYDRYNLTGQQVVSVSNNDEVEPLREKNWVEMAVSVSDFKN